MRTTCSTEVTKILPSPILPVRADLTIASIALSTWPLGTTTSIFTLGRKSTTYSAPRYSSVWPFCRPNPFTSVTVSPVTPISERASRTSSSLNGFTIASIFFMPSALSLGLRMESGCYRITPVLAKAARRDAHARRRLAALVFVQLDEPHHAAHGVQVVASGGDLLGRHVALHVAFHDGVEHLVGRKRVLVGLAGCQLGRRRAVDHALR